VSRFGTVSAINLVPGDRVALIATRQPGGQIDVQVDVNTAALTVPLDPLITSELLLARAGQG
jgi:hypothetical protein